MSGSLLSEELQNVLRTQGIETETHVGVYDCPEGAALAKKIVGEDRVVVFEKISEAVTAAKSNAHYVILASIDRVRDVITALGAEANSIVAVIGVGESDDAPSSAMLRSVGAMSVIRELEEVELSKLLKRALEFRALRALELLHRCESRRLLRRERDLLGHPPETMTDDLSTFQPPPLPVGAISTYNLEDASESFERAYIDRVQLLCESAREAAKYLDVSAATLARRLRREA